MNRLLPVLALLGLFSVSVNADEAAVARALDAFHDAASRADQDAYFELMTDNVVFLGTDATERWQGQEFREFVNQYFPNGQGWTYTPTERRIDLAPDGSWALFDELLINEKLGQCRGSGVLVRQEGQWRIAQYNLSVPVPNDIVLDVAEQIRAVDAQAKP
jgi:ketosteroid isomerase-like protein